jgi:3-dehydroquinate synthase
MSAIASGGLGWDGYVELVTNRVTTIEVAVPGAAYPVHVGAGLLDDVDDLVTPPPHATRVAVVSAGYPLEHHAPRVAAGLERLGLDVTVVEVPEGEANKTLATVERCCRAFAAIPLGRDDLVVAVGGGVVGDMVGFAAAVWNRGVPVVQVATTLLAQVDSAIGGKTGVDLPEGKNLVGAFHQPRAVLADTATLRSLPQRERRAGLGEVLKYGFIADPEVLRLLEDHPAEAVAGEPKLMDELVRRSVAVKAHVVAADEREAGDRALLNYGHTVGHAIEALGGYTRHLHGEAVALGMVFAARLGEHLALSEPGLADRTVAALRGLGLPTGGVDLDPPAVWDLLRRDKKARRGVRFVVCTKPGDAHLIDQPPVEVVDEVLATLTTD